MTSQYKTLRPLFLDFETTNLDKGSAVTPENRIVLACWKQDGVRHHCRGDQYHQPALYKAGLEADLLVAHHAKFELQWLRRMGINLEDICPVFDTLLAQKVRASNRQWPLSLDLVAGHYGLGHKSGPVHALIQGGVCPSEIPESMLLEYCTRDVDLTDRVFHAQLEVMSDAELALLQTRTELTPVLADIEFNGMALDTVLVFMEHQKLTAKLVEYEREIETLAPGINWNSTLQVAKLLYEDWGIPELQDRHGNPVRTATGRPKADTDTIAQLRGTTAKARKFLEIKQAASATSSLLSKYITKMQECCDNEGILYASFNQSTTKTDRTSSSGAKYKIQFQNIYRQYKGLFKARPGYVYLSADGSQIEFRVAAGVGNDATAISDIRSGYPVHQRTADILTGAGQPTSYQDAKPHTFKPLYGGMSGTDAEIEYYKAFRERYPDIYKTQTGWTVEVLKNGQYTLPWGVTYYFPGTVASRSGYIENTSNIFNYPIQALATAEIIPIVVAGVWRDMKLAGLASRIVNLVHDDILIEAVPAEVEALREILLDNFLSACYNVLKERYSYEFKVPLGCAIKTGLHWGEGNETKYEADI